LDLTIGKVGNWACHAGPDGWAQAPRHDHNVPQLELQLARLDGWDISGVSMVVVEFYIYIIYILYNIYILIIQHTVQVIAIDYPKNWNERKESPRITSHRSPKGSLACGHWLRWFHAHGGAEVNGEK
jgi:hypothetical protein